MSATNASIIERAIKDYTKKMYDKIEKRCDSYCGELLSIAITERIKKRPKAHDFTGNLLNSIVVCLYRERRPIRAYFAFETIDNAIRVKMTSPRKYFFKDDYQHTTSKYHWSDPAEISTNQGLGEDDAIRFFQQYKPSGNNIFDIVVAYTTEYASYVEAARGTVGFLQAYDHAEDIGVEFLGLPRC